MNISDELWKRLMEKYFPQKPAPQKPEPQKAELFR